MLASSTPNFDGLARWYALLEGLTFGRALSRCRTQHLAEAATARRALLFGDGDGRFAARLAAAAPALSLTAVDCSGAMLEQLRLRVERAVPGIELTCLHGDARAIVLPAAAPDLVVTHFFFDCLSSDEVATLVGRIVPTLPPDARWLVSDFAVPAGSAGWLARVLIRVLYLGFALLTGLATRRLPNYTAVLEAHGFECSRTSLQLFGILRSELWTRTAGDSPRLEPPPS